MLLSESVILENKNTRFALGLRLAIAAEKRLFLEASARSYSFTASPLLWLICELKKFTLSLMFVWSFKGANAWSFSSKGDSFSALPGKAYFSS